VIDPNCDLFPTSVTLWPHSASVDTWLRDSGGQVSRAPDVAVVPFNEKDCLLTITVKGKATTEPADPMSPHGVDTVVWVGAVDNDPTIGPFFKVEARTSCLRPEQCDPYVDERRSPNPLRPGARRSMPRYPCWAEPFLDSGELIRVRGSKGCMGDQLPGEWVGEQRRPTGVQQRAIDRRLKWRRPACNSSR